MSVSRGAPAVSSPRRVARHAFDHDERLRGLMESSSRKLEALLREGPTGSPKRVHWLGDLGQRILTRASLFERDERITLVAARAIAQSRAGWLVLSSRSAGLEVDIPFGEGSARLEAIGPNAQAYIGAWCEGFYAALAARDSRSLALLGGITDETLRASLALAADYQFAWKASLLAFRSEPASALFELENALALSARALLSEAPPTATRVQRSTFALLGCLIRRDRAEFNDALSLALEEHRAFWGTENDAQDPSGWLAWGPLALCCIAHDLGIPTDVESEYLLPALIERRFTAETP